MKKQAKIETSAHSKKIATAIRKQMLSDAPAVLSHVVEKNELGDIIAFCDYRVTCRARMIAADYALVLAVDGARGCLDGLRVGTFEGLAIGPDHGAGDVYACFTNGRNVPFISEDVKPLTDASERTARELEYARLHKTEETVKAATDRRKRSTAAQIKTRKENGAGRSKLSFTVQGKIRELYDATSKARSHSWRCGQVAMIAGKQNLKRIHGDPITKRNVSDYIHRTAKPD
jgi:hypothetical protein